MLRSYSTKCFAILTFLALTLSWQTNDLQAASLEDTKKTEKIYPELSLAPELITGVVIDSVAELNPSCGNINGELHIEASGGTPPLMYSIDGGITFQDDPIFTELGADDYLVLVLDAVGCFDQASPQLVSTPEIGLLAVPGCATGGTININLTVVGGTQGDSEFSWEGPGGATYDTQDLTEVPQGSYSVTITDRVGCTGTTSVTLEDCCDGMEFCNADVVQSGCEGSSTGSITLNPMGGAEPYSYAWSHDASITGNAANNLGAGMYMVTVEDANGCMNICNYTISESENVMISGINVTDPICGEANGSISISLEDFMDDTCPVQYSIDGGITFQDDASFAGLSEGTYQVVVRDCNSCVDMETVTLSDNGNPNLFNLMTFCVDDEFLDIVIGVAMGTPPYTYAWEGPNGFTSTEGNLSGLENGDYFLTVTDANGCTTTGQASKLEDCGSCGSIEGYVWEDKNGNGVQQADEFGIPNVPVFLFDADDNLITSSTTNGDGTYAFTELPKGDFYVLWDPGANFEATASNAAGDDTVDSDLDNSNGPGTSMSFTIAGCETVAHVDAGFFVCSRIGKKVFFDKNENNLCDVGETGINGVVIEIYRRNELTGEFVLFGEQTSGTNADTGEYGFWSACVPPGDYYLQITTSIDGLALVLADAGDDSIDSDFTESNGPGTTDIFTVESGVDKCDIAAGFMIEATLGDRVWYDQNANGMREASEPGMEDILVEVYNQSGYKVGQAYTNQNGSYTLQGLGTQDHYVKFTPPPGYGFTMAFMGDEETSSVVDHSNGLNTTPHYSTVCGIHTPNVDAGLVAGVLPASWLGFSAEHLGNEILLQWSIADASNLELFEIEKSSDGIHFQKITEIENNEGLQYEYSDTDIWPVTSYYRIKQQDKNTSYNYSQIIAVNPMSNVTELAITPNPAVDIITISGLTEGQAASYVIYDEKGSLVRQQNSINTSDPKLTITDLQEGVYIIRVSIEGAEQSFRFIKTN